MNSARPEIRDPGRVLLFPAVAVTPLLVAGERSTDSILLTRWPPVARGGKWGID